MHIQHVKCDRYSFRCSLLLPILKLARELVHRVQPCLTIATPLSIQAEVAQTTANQSFHVIANL